MYKKLIIFYFSGTGNARKVSEWICNKATEYGINFELVDISKNERNNLPEIDISTLIGFCSPTHGFNFPPLVMNFILHFPPSFS